MEAKQSQSIYCIFNLSTIYRNRKEGDKEILKERGMM